MSEASVTPPAQEGMFSPARRRYVLGVLVIVYTFNFIDRQILSILIEPIKAEMGFSDSAMGFLTGFGFAMFYATVGVPIALWADRGNRRNLIALALAIWSAMTAFSGLVQNFWQLAIARFGVGIGEAGCSPPSHSIISDLYTHETRATALGIYSLGIPFGILFGFLAGGWINEFFGWRMAFFVVGIPGVLLALLVRFTVTEPPRGMSDNRQAVGAAPSIPEVFKFLKARPAFLHMAVGGALTAFVGYGVVSWVPSFLIRSHGMSTGEVGTWLGLILGIPGGIGIVLGGYLADKFGERDVRWYLWLVTVALLLSVPFSVGVFLSPTATGALLFLIIPVALGNFYQATTFAQTQSLVKLRMRAVAAAILLFILNIIGLGLGPQAVGIISDVLKPEFGDESLRYALLICGFVNIWAAFHYWKAGTHLKKDLARVEEDS